MKLRARLRYIFFILLITGCAATTQKVVGDQEIKENLAAFLEDGKTTKQEVLLKLGIPSAQFEEERILTYRLGLNDQGTMVVGAPEFILKDRRISRWMQSCYSLVLVFDDRNILKQHSLLKVR